MLANSLELRMEFKRVTEECKPTRKKSKYLILDQMKVGANIFTTERRDKVQNAVSKRYPKKYTINKVKYEGVTGLKITRTI